MLNISERSRNRDCSLAEREAEAYHTPTATLAGWMFFVILCIVGRVSDCIVDT